LRGNCVGRLCGANIPPKEGRGTTNVLSVYLDDYPQDDSEELLPILLGVFVPLLALVAVLGIALVVRRTKIKNETKMQQQTNKDIEAVEERSASETTSGVVEE
jgi:cytoskeletal protein RodZ